MLVALKIQSFVLIDSLELRLEPGYNVLTGETGAGKSIIVGALNLVLGGRARTDLVRPGSKEAVIEALFDIGGHAAITEQLERAGIQNDGELVIRRVVHVSGRSRAYINGRLCTVGELAALASELADVTSQHESVALADARRHIDYLDRYASLSNARRQLASVVDEVMKLSTQLRTLRERERGRAEREAFLRYQLDAIEALQPQPGELDELAAERSRLKHAGRLSEATTSAVRRLDGISADGAAGLCDELGKVAADLTSAAAIDQRLLPLSAEIDASWATLREVARDIARYAEQIQVSPARLEEVQDRIFRIEELLRRHGPTIEDMLAARARIEAELAELSGVEEAIPQLQKARDELLGKAARRARKLSKQRHRAAAKLGEAISAELVELGMGEARVVIEVTRAACGESTDGDTELPSLVVDDARLGRTGIDRVQFLIAPNRGMSPRPLGRIASGGELSRALLALKRALGAASSGEAGRGAGIQVFDEVDSGVGGETADRIGRAIAGIAHQRQVLCITHMAAIACYADAHFVVTKHDADTTSIAQSAIARVEGPARVAEVARMLTGTKVTKSSKRAALELLRDARPPKHAAA